MSELENDREQKHVKPAVERLRVGSRVSIFKDTKKSPFWHMSYSVDGKQFRPSTKSMSKKQATIIARERDAELVLGKNPSNRKRELGIARVTAEFLKHHERKKSADGTRDNYSRDLEQFLAFATVRGVHRLDHVDEGLLEAFQLQLEEKGLKGIMTARKRGRPLKPNGPGTVRNKLKSVRQLIRWAVRRRLLREDPSSGFVIPPKSDIEADCWTMEEVQSILKHSPDPWRGVFEFFLVTGLRSNELCWLMKDDVDLGAKPLIQIRSKSHAATGTRWRPKHGRSRVVPLVPIAVEILSRSMRMSKGPWAFWSPLSRGPRRGQYRSGALLAALHRAKKAAGVDKGVIHTFRHVFCAFAANRRVSPFKVMKILGHGSLTIILRYYHISDSELLDSLNELPFDEVFNLRAI